MVERPYAVEAPPLTLSLEDICFFVANARRFVVKDLDTIPDTASNPSDDGMIEVLEDNPDDPVRQELVAFINSLNVDEQLDLVTLAWIGRGDGTLEDWASLRALAASEHNQRTAEYLLVTPLLPDYIEEAVGAFGRSCAEFDVRLL
jgi:hypothetical protein